MPVGTARSLTARIREAAPAGDEVEVAWNPEFLREGFAVQDSLSPDRFVFGVASQRAAELLRQVYAAPLANGIPWLAMDLETAELVKVSANAFLATKISFINAMAEVCEKVGADVVRLAEALGARRADRQALPGAWPWLRGRLPAEGHPRVPVYGQRARGRIGGQPPQPRWTPST